ncbi:MAG: Na+ dependent nucleoside transporter N-terminal domain-containing protein, partial [Gemmatimonadota bacterium]
MVSWKRVLWLMVPLLLIPAVAWGVQEGGSTLIQTGGIEEPFLLRLGRGALAMAVILFVLWRFSPKRKSIDWTLVAKGVGLQFIFALLVLKT